jgi:ABC-type multidrug transport system fused ATPase/permease subunit
MTSSITDHETDTIIQNSLRNELGTDVTVLTIAHRLQTIMDADKIVSFLVIVTLRFVRSYRAADGSRRRQNSKISKSPHSTNQSLTWIMAGRI